jgi:hypothetical protein
VKAIEILPPSGGDPADQLLGRDALGLGLQHHRRAVRVVGTHEVHGPALHALETHPDVGLDVLHDVADVERSVRERQRSRDEQGTQGTHGRNDSGLPAIRYPRTASRG